LKRQLHKTRHLREYKNANDTKSEQKLSGHNQVNLANESNSSDLIAQTTQITPLAIVGTARASNATPLTSLHILNIKTKTIN
jgi:hypothetical protein